MKSIVAVGSGNGSNGRRAAFLSDEARHLWTRLCLGRERVMDPATGTRRIGFCSTYPGEGTTSSATNFAICLGQQGLKTCLVETNLRTRSLAAHFGCKKRAGLSELLSGTLEPEEAVVHDVAPGLDLLVAGRLPGDPYSLLSTSSIHSILEELEPDLDALIVDVPALSTSPESGLILPCLDAAVLVVEANKTRRQDVTRSVSTLGDLGVSFAGAVINKMTYDLPVFLDRAL